ncbi:MAG: AraC family transcriptional regulator [Xanthobacteraceae bacterium]|jgi:AraC family transcriptional regulator
MLANSHVLNVLLRAPGDRELSPQAAALSSLSKLAAGSQTKRRHDDHVSRARPQSGIDAAEPLVEIYPSDAVKRRALTWNGMTVETVEVEKHCRFESRFRGPTHLLALFEEGARDEGVTFVEGLPRATLRNYRQKFLFVPAGHEYYDWQEPRSLTRAVYFYFDAAALRIDPRAEFSDLLIAPRMFFEDARLWDYAMRLKALVDQSQPVNPLYCEALGIVLAHELMRLNHGTPPVETPVRGGLATWQQRAVTRFIEEHLEEQISLDTLAKLVRLSRYHFCRSFKQSFGMPPHRFHTVRRIEHAKSLLARRSVSVTDVGMAIGFSETSSFTAAFRKATGLTPTGYQRSVA